MSSNSPAATRSCTDDRTLPTVWPGTAYPLGATYDGAGTNFSLFSEVAEQGRVVPDRQGRQRGRGSPSTRSTATSGTPTCPPSPRASATASGCTGRGIPAAGHRCDPSKLLLDPYGKSFHGDFDFTQALFSYDLDAADATSRSGGTPPRVDSLGHTMTSVVINPFFDWGVRPRAAHALPRDGHLRGARQGHDADPSRHPRGAARHLRRAGPPGDHRPPQVAERDRDRADAGAPVHARPPTARPRACETTGATTPSASSPRTTSTRPTGTPAARSPSSRPWCAAFHEAGIEVILDVVYNHTAEGNHLGPTINFRGIDNAAYYRLVDDDLRFYKDFTGTGNSLNARHPHTLQLIMDSLRYWVTRDARRRVPLRPGLHAGPRVLRRRPVERVLRSGAAGSGGQPGQTDRRTVGRRRGRLPGRQLPGFVDRVEREVSRHCARLLAGRARNPGRIRLPADRVVGPLRGDRPAAQRQHQLRHRPRRLHAARPGVLQREAQRGQRRGQPRRREPQPVVELRRRRPHRRPGHPGAALPPDAQLLGHPDASARARR